MDHFSFSPGGEDIRIGGVSEGIGKVSTPTILMVPRRAIVCLLVFLMSSGPTLAQKRTRSAELGEALAQSCMLCHGAKGGSTEQAIPTIGGQIDSYLVDSMKAYRDDRRPAGVMNRIAKAYSLKEIEALAYYFGRQPFARHEQATDPEKVVLGQAIHKRKCAKCHLHDGRDSAVADSPLLAGQKLGYLQRNMTEILAGKRSIETDMEASLKGLSLEEIDATLHFYASRHGEGN